MSSFCYSWVPKTFHLPVLFSRVPLFESKADMSSESYRGHPEHFVMLAVVAGGDNYYRKTYFLDGEF